jgi:beta-N-acetylhexosaminidase
MDVVSDNIGIFFIVSFPEQVPGDDTLYYIQDNHIGGIILFAEHCRHQDSLKSWLNDFKRTLNRPLLVAVDQEGGRVRRFQQGFPMLEAPRYYGHHARHSQYYSDLARVCEQLYEIGVNFNLSPSVDLMDTCDGHVMDTRTFSDNPEIVSRFARTAVAIHKDQGLLTCAKHFPGLGRSEGDPHEILSVSNLTEKDFEEVELPPFKDVIDFGVDTVMVTHLSIPDVDDKPAIISEKIIDGWLKDKLGFAGAVITDDLLMGGAANIDSAPTLASKSFAAGSDLLLFGQNLKLAKEALESFRENWHSGLFKQQRQVDAGQRVNSLMQKIL